MAYLLYKTTIKFYCHYANYVLIIELQGQEVQTKQSLSKHKSWDILKRKKTYSSLMHCWII